MAAGSTAAMNDKQAAISKKFNVFIISRLGAIPASRIGAVAIDIVA